MATKIEFQTWSGGEGWNDPRFLIGYCKESPVEVLQYVYKNYYIYDYEGIYRPVCHSYPNNVMGLVISRVDDFKITGCEVRITASITDLDLSRVYSEKVNRTIKTYQNAIEGCKRWHLSDGLKQNNPKVYERRLRALAEIESVILR